MVKFHYCLSEGSSEGGQSTGGEQSGEGGHSKGMRHRKRMSCGRFGIGDAEV